MPSVMLAAEDAHKRLLEGLVQEGVAACAHVVVHERGGHARRAEESAEIGAAVDLRLQERGEHVDELVLDYEQAEHGVHEVAALARRHHALVQRAQVRPLAFARQVLAEWRVQPLVQEDLLLTVAYLEANGARVVV